MIIAQALLLEDGFRIVEAADKQTEFDKFSFHKTILSTYCSSAFLLLIGIIYTALSSPCNWKPGMLSR